MPELPEVEALASFLRDRAVGRVVARVDPVAISVLKTSDPPATALAAPPLDPPAIRVVSHGVTAGGATSGSV